MNVHYFDIDLLKHCTLHILNLGLLGVSNGSTLSLTIVLNLTYFLNRFFFNIGILRKKNPSNPDIPTNTPSHWCTGPVLHPRGMLLDMGVFGDVSGGYQPSLDKAFAEFETLEERSEGSM